MSSDIFLQVIYSTYCVRVYCNIVLMVTANMAVKKPAFQLSADDKAAADKAGDNDLATSSCTDSLVAERCWAVDLGSPMDVSCLCVTNGQNHSYGEICYSLLPRSLMLVSRVKFGLWTKNNIP